MAEIFRFLAFLNLVTNIISMLVLEYSHTNVILKITEDVTLRCIHGNASRGKAERDVEIDQITRIRLLKLGDAGNDRWNTLAEVAVPDAFRVKLTQPSGSEAIHASGFAGRPGESHLSVTWPTASELTVGRYKCEVDGFVAGDRSDFHMNTITVNITSHIPSPSDLVHVIMQLKEKSDKMYEHMEKMAKRHELALAILKKEIHGYEENQTRYILNEVVDKIEENVHEARHWPGGNYSLLATADGCPETPFRNFHEGFIKFKYKSKTEQKHIVPTPGHLKGPLIVKRCGNTNDITFAYCNMKTGINEQKLPWPKGSYCISPPKNRECPINFSLGDVNFYLASMSTPEISFEDPPYYSGSNPYDFSFCCRKDGQPNVPIYLPSGRPFYLYRYGGRCQSVRSMDVSVEWVELDTDDSQNDHYDFGDIHPDSNLNNLRLFLCYYTKQGR